MMMKKTEKQNGLNKLARKLNRLPLLLALSVMMLALAGCGGSGEKGSTPYLDGISVSLADESTGDSLDHKYTVKLRDADGKPAEIDSVGLSLTMTGMDHKQEAELEPAGEGVYEVKLTMLMNANWRKVVILKKDNHVRKVAGAAIRTQLK